MRPAILAGLAAALLVATATAQEEGAQIPDVPRGPAAIEGRVLHAGRAAGVPNVEVVLYALRAASAPGSRRTTTDGAGRFVFEGVSNAPDVAYLVGASYAGVPFPGGRVTFGAGELRQSLEIRIADLTSDPSGIQVVESRIRFDWAGGRWRVHEAHRLRNPGSRAYYVPAASRAQGLAAFRARLPESASGFSMPFGMVPEGVVQSDRDLAFYGPLYPGEQEIGFDYALPALPGSTSLLRKGVPAGAESAVVLVPESLPVEASPPLDEREPEHVEGRRYRTFAASGLAPGALLELRVEVPDMPAEGEGLRVAETQFFLELDGAALLVREAHRLEADALLVGSPTEPLLRIALPEGARDLRFPSETLALGLAAEPEGGLVLQGPVAAGESTLELVYQMPVADGGAHLERHFDVAVPLVSVYVADTGLRIRSERLHRRRPVRSADRTYVHLEAYALDAGEKLDLRLETLDRARSVPAGAGAFFVALAAVAAALLLSAPLRGRAAEDSVGADEAESPAQREREALYAAIHDLDHDFETGKVAAEDHRTLRQDLRLRALALLRAERESAPAPAAPSPMPPPTCPACQGVLRPTDRFCAQCGQRLQDGEREASA